MYHETHILCLALKLKSLYYSSADPEGGTGGPDPHPPPPGKSQIKWVSIGNKQLDPPWKKLDAPWKMLDPLWNLEK